MRREKEGTGELEGDPARGVEQEWCRAAGEGAGGGEGAVSSLPVLARMGRQKTVGRQGGGGVGLVMERERDGADGADASEPPSRAELLQARANDDRGVSPDAGGAIGAREEPVMEPVVEKAVGVGERAPGH